MSLNKAIKYGAITLVKQYKVVRYVKQPYCNVESKGE